MNNAQNPSLMATLAVLLLMAAVTGYWFLTSQSPTSSAESSELCAKREWSILQSLEYEGRKVPTRQAPSFATVGGYSVIRVMNVLGGNTWILVASKCTSAPMVLPEADLVLSTNDIEVIKANVNPSQRVMDYLREHSAKAGEKEKKGPGSN